MPKFRKKPIIIEAERFDQDSKPWPEGVEGTVVYNGTKRAYDGQFYIFNKEQKGHISVNSGDWIITGVNGERYPCSPDVFMKTYELIEERGD